MLVKRLDKVPHTASSRAPTHTPVAHGCPALRYQRSWPHLDAQPHAGMTISAATETMSDDDEHHRARAATEQRGPCGAPLRYHNLRSYDGRQSRSGHRQQKSLAASQQLAAPWQRRARAWTYSAGRLRRRCCEDTFGAVKWPYVRVLRRGLKRCSRLNASETMAWAASRAELRNAVNSRSVNNYSQRE